MQKRQTVVGGGRSQVESGGRRPDGFLRFPLQLSRGIQLLPRAHPVSYISMLRASSRLLSVSRHLLSPSIRPHLPPRAQSPIQTAAMSDLTNIFTPNACPRESYPISRSCLHHIDHISGS